MDRLRNVVGFALAAAGALVLGLACGARTRTAPPVAPEIDTADGLLARGARDPSKIFAGAGYGASYGIGSDDSNDDDDDALARYTRAQARTYGNGGLRYGGYYIDVEAFDPRPPVPRPAADYTPAVVAKSGTIEGTVRWKRPPRTAATLATGSKVCGELPNRSLELDGRGRVAGAVVYLEGITTGRALLKGVSGFGRSDALQLGGTVVASACQLWPRVQVVMPVGGKLAVTRRGPGLRGVAVYPRDANRPPRTLDLAGEGVAQVFHLSSFGAYELVPSPVLPSRAWVYVPKTPYAAVSASGGAFRFDQVPPGTYRLVVWHPPLITGLDADGVPVMSPAVERRRTVVVKAGKATRAPLSLD